MIGLGSWDYLEKRRILITGGTGSLGRRLTRQILEATSASTVLIYSRDEVKQQEMRRRSSPEHEDRQRFFLGDVRDKDRLRRAMAGVDYVIHTAALKQIPAAEYNPFECVKTNILGAENVIDSAIDQNVVNVVALSTDKAVNPINLYGATKLCSDKIFVAGNSYSGSHRTRFSVARYGNVVGSRGSVIPFFLAQRRAGFLPITDPRMTRFWITQDQASNLVLNALREMKGGEIWVPRLPSMRVVDLAEVIGPECERRVIGIRPGEKLHELMVPTDDARQTLEFPDHYVIKPSFPRWQAEWHSEKGGVPCSEDFYYGSDNNAEWLSASQLTRMIAELDLPEAREWAGQKGARSRG